jgi:integrase
MVPLYVQLKLSWGLRKKDILDLPALSPTTTEHVLEISKSKRWREREGKRVGQKRRLVITPSIAALIAEVRALKGRPHICQNLFTPTRGKNRGKRYTDNGFDSILQNAMKKFVEEGGIAFHEHDIRASTATLDPTNAMKRLGHKRQATTDKYLRQLDVLEIVPLEVTLVRKKT